MGKSIRSKRMKKLRSLKREKLMPREQILLEQRAAIISVVKGEEVDEAALPVLPEDANAPKRFAHTKTGLPKKVHTLKSRYGALAGQNVSVNKWNTLEALKERYDKKPAVKVKEEAEAAEGASAASSSSAQKLPTTTAQRRSRGRDRTSRSIAASSAAADPAVKVEDDESMGDAAAAAADPDAEEVVDLEDDTIRYGEFGKPAHTRQSVIRSKLARKRSKSRSKGGFLNWHNLAASS